MIKKFCTSCACIRSTDVYCFKCNSELIVCHKDWIEPKLPPIDLIRGFADVAGYCITEHGSKERDLDLVAVPWTDDAWEVEDFIKLLIFNIDFRLGIKGTRVVDSGKKPHGRIAYSIQLAGWYKLIDLSVMPLMVDNLGHNNEHQSKT